MNPKYKASWIKALRSDQFKQGRLRLVSSDGKYCCLGVLCKIAGVPRDTHGCFDGDAVSLSSQLMVEFGIPYRQVINLMSLNDASKLSFNKIADYIEKNL